jgi:hypothetical protein
MGLAVGLKTCSWKNDFAETRRRAEFHSLVMSLEEYCSLYGQMPNSWNDLIEAGLAEPSQDKQLHLRVYCSHNDRKEVRGTEIDTTDYELRFGVGPSDILVENGQLTDADGHPIILIWPCGKHDIIMYESTSATRVLYEGMLEHEALNQ